MGGRAAPRRSILVHESDRPLEKLGWSVSAFVFAFAFASSQLASRPPDSCKQLQRSSRGAVRLPILGAIDIVHPGPHLGPRGRARLAFPPSLSPSPPSRPVQLCWDARQRIAGAKK